MSKYALRFGLANELRIFNRPILLNRLMYRSALYLPSVRHSSMAMEIEYASISSGSSR